VDPASPTLTPFAASDLTGLPATPPASLTDKIDWSGLATKPLTDDEFLPNPTPPLRSLQKKTSVKASMGSTQLFQRTNQENNAGGFPAGMPLLGNRGEGPVTLVFCQPITAFATYVQVRYHCSHIRQWRSFLI
jgi:hypothetical protein